MKQALPQESHRLGLCEGSVIALDPSLAGQGVGQWLSGPGAVLAHPMVT